MKWSSQTVKKPRPGHAGKTIQSDVYSKLIENELYVFSPEFLCFIFSRMHLALKAYQELLLNLNEMDHSQDESIRQSANIIKSKTLRVHALDSCPQLNRKYDSFLKKKKKVQVRVYDSWF